MCPNDIGCLADIPGWQSANSMSKANKVKVFVSKFAKGHCIGCHGFDAEIQLSQGFVVAQMKSIFDFFSSQNLALEKKTINTKGLHF